ncbi:MAG: hypothetical protein FWF01_03785 [Alphaproteobacteria bacterium]|nr:hypothetical protein [Alphaproteobacteria bacterium]
MKRLLFVFMALGFVWACGGSFKPDYKVTDASHKKPPSWIQQNNAHKSDSEGSVRDYRYFISDARSVDKRLCLKSAEARATQKIASEIAQHIMAMYEEETMSADSNVSRRMRDSLEQSVQVNLHGVKVTATYWEKRSYRREMGAPEDKVAYKCDVAVRISRSVLIEALETYRKRTMAQLDADSRRAMDRAVSETIREIKDYE